MSRNLCLCLVLAGCGRIAFDPLGDASSNADTSVDAALGAWSTPTPVVLPVLGVDDDPSLTADLLVLYFNRNTSEIFATSRTAVGQPWAVPVQVAELSTGSGTVPELLDDGIQIYFASGRAGGLGALDVWAAARASRSTAWVMFATPPELNSISDNWPGSMTVDRLEMVLSSNATGNLDLLITTRSSPTGTWNVPQRIPALATPDFEDEGHLTANGLALYYSGSGPDLYVSRRTSRTEAFGVGTPIVELNSPSSDRDAWVSADERYIMFSSTRDGQSALYEAFR